MFDRLFRWITTILGAAIGVGLAELLIVMFRKGWLTGNSITFTTAQIVGMVLAGAIIFAMIFYSLTPRMQRHSKKAAESVSSDLSKVSNNGFLGGIIGLIIGLIVAYLIIQIYDNSITQPILLLVINLIAYILLGSAGVMIGSRKGREILSAFTSRINTPGGRKGRESALAPKILDTSVIIDGRIADIMKSGFLEGDIIIPDFVLVELRHIADSSDSLKRNRGRRGLDVLNKIESEYGIEIYDTTRDKGIDDIPEVDVKLLKLAQIKNGKVVTNDFNLNKVAGIQGVPVLNINELANALKPIVLPGEEMDISLVKEGTEKGQAVAYLDDGTMIVVEDGNKFIGENATVIVSSVLQTSAGRMIFAKIKKEK